MKSIWNIKKYYLFLLNITRTKLIYLNCIANKIIKMAFFVNIGKMKPLIESINGRLSKVGR